MSNRNRLVRHGKTWHEYNISYDAGNHGEATKVRFGPRDRWVGNDYWRHVKTYEPSRKERAFLLMSMLENRKMTHQLGYQIARCVVLTELGYGDIAQSHLQKWKAHHESNDTGIYRR